MIRFLATGCVVEEVDLKDDMCNVAFTEVSPGMLLLIHLPKVVLLLYNVYPSI